MNIDNRIKELIKKRGLTQRELARRLQTTDAYVSNCISQTNGCFFSIPMLAKVAEILEVPFWQLFAPKDAVNQDGAGEQNAMETAPQPDPIPEPESEPEPQSDFIAFIRFNGRLYQTESPEEMKKLAEMMLEAQGYNSILNNDELSTLADNSPEAAIGGFLDKWNNIPTRGESSLF